MKTIAPADKLVLDRFKALLAEHNLLPEEMIFHGSRARGEAHEDSDYDVLLIYPQVTLELKNNVIDLSSELLRETGDFVHPIMISNFEAYESPERGSNFMINVYDDGIAV